MIPIRDAALLFGAALLGGTINSVAGGGGFLCFPALLFTGMPPIQANATNTVALWPGTVASVGAYRREFSGTRRHLAPLVISGAVGAILGARILLHTPQATFLRMVPWLLLVATILFTFSRPVSRAFHRLSRSAHSGHDRKALALAMLLQMLISVYIGFFGAGAGILMLALFAILGIENIHTLNGMKSLLATVCNGVAIVTFVLAGAVVWPQALLMTIGASIGGYAGAHYAQKMDARIVRAFVVAVGIALTAWFFYRLT